MMLFNNSLVLLGLDSPMAGVASLSTFELEKEKESTKKHGTHVVEDIFVFWIKILFFEKKIYKNSFDFKLLPNLVRLGHVG